MKNLKNYLNENHNFDKSTMFGICSLIMVISGVFGFIFEFIFYYFNGGMKTFYWQGGNFIPWINIYAIGAILIFFLAYKYRKNALKVYVISSLSSGLLEYFSGLFIYIIGDGLRYWDYNTEILNFGNIQGFVCLRSFILFGLAGFLVIYLVVPFCFNLAKKMNKKKFLIISITLISIIFIDEIYNLLIARLFHLPRASVVYQKLGLKYYY